MREVVVIGVGMTPFGKSDKTVMQLGAEAARLALLDANILQREIEAGYCGSVYADMLLGQKIFKQVGIDGLPVYNLENACSSGATAFHEAYLAIASGRFDTALVVGAEKLTALGSGTIPLDLNDHEVRQGLNMPAIYAMRAIRYMEEYGLTRETLAKVTVKSRKNASLNHYAPYRKTITVEEVLNSRLIAYPITLPQCCPAVDGGAAAVLCSTQVSKKYTSNPIKILVSELTSGRYTNGYRDMTIPEITVRSAKEAYKLAGIGPEDVDLAEVHDAFSIAELLYYEALQFCERGGAPRLLEDGHTEIGGKIAVNPSGGLLSKGHPLGATGIAQIFEIITQLRGKAGERQVPNAKVGLTHCTGGGIAGFDHGACSIHIFER